MSEAREAAITVAYNTVTGNDDEEWNPDRTLEALKVLHAAGVAEGIRRALHEAAQQFEEIETHFSVDDGTKVDFAAHEVAEKLRAMADGADTD